MTRVQLLAFATLLASAGAGVYLYSASSNALTQASAPPGGFEILDRSQCTVAACAAPLCVQGDNVLTDAGSACSTRLVTCSVRIGQGARNWAADAGLQLGPQRYQRARFVGLRCPGIDGGNAFAVPMTDDGLPQYMSVAQVTPLCVRAPYDGGTDCQRAGAETDGGNRFFGTGNVFPAAQGVGTQCEPVECTVFSGDRPETDL